LRTAPGLALRAARVLTAPTWTPLEAVSGLWRNRALIPYFGRRFLERRYARTVLGWIWIPLRPTFDVGARVLLFGGFLGVASGDRPYFMFFIVGMSAWILFERTAFWAIRALEINRALLARAHVSRLGALVAAAVPGVLDFLLYLGLALIGGIYYKAAQGTSYLVVDPRGVAAVLTGLGLLVLYGLGIGLWTCTAAAEARDVRFFARYVFGFWYFLTPVIYPISTIPERYRAIAELNPITAPVELVKYGLLRTAPPEISSLSVSLAFLLALLGGGLWYFARSQRVAVERI
jgi:lipopolysaccharide transport system permease protein